MLARLPRSPLLPVLLGMLLVLPTMTGGLVMDDVLIRMRLLGVETAWGEAPWWDLYTFARPDLNADLRDAGFHPWWADPDVKMTFFRPISAATHVLDYALWPLRPALHHLHSVLWYGLAVAAVVALFRRIHRDEPHVAVLAGLLLAVAGPHAATVGWVAARNTLIALVLGALMLLLHLRGGVRGRLAAAGVLVVGLLSGEAILGALAYVAAWQLFMVRGPLWERLRVLVPYGLIVVVWRVLYVASGFGSQHTGIYHDPGSDLPGFLAAVGTNLPVLLLSRWLLVPVDGWAILPPVAHTAQVGVAVALLPLIAALAWPLLRRSAVARFWAAGMVLSLVPFTATLPMDRLVLFAGPGFAALLALLALAPQAAGLRRAGIIGLLVIHLPVSGLLSLVRSATIALNAGPFTSGLHQAPADADVPGQTFVYITGTFHRVHYTTLMRQTTRQPAPRRSVVLSSMSADSAVTRVDEDTLHITPTDGFMFLDLDRIHRRDATGLSVGEVIPLPDLDVEILALTDDGRPATAAFHFRVPLTDPSLRLLAVEPVDPDAFPPAVETRPFALPDIGQTVTVAGVMPRLP